VRDPAGKLQGKRAVVTGGCGGIGWAVCRRFAAEGAEVVACDVANLDRTPAEGVRVQRLDVTDEGAVGAFFDAHGADDAPLHILVNAAGIEIEKTIEDTTLEEWNRIFADQRDRHVPDRRNTRCRCCARAEEASIINFGSYDGFIADPHLAAYCATKGAVHALTRAMACDHGPEGIRVNAVCPGYIDTPMLQSFFTGDGSGDIESDGCSRRCATCTRCAATARPDDIANLVNWLASDEARYASGQLWVLDGGLSAQVQQMRL
jgi:NAD(P)-dependent dehydrogenase (short-subunit alcohol dehydrogenase family)